MKYIRLFDNFQSEQTNDVKDIFQEYVDEYDMIKSDSVHTLYFMMAHGEITLPNGIYYDITHDDKKTKISICIVDKVDYNQVGYIDYKYTKVLINFAKKSLPSLLNRIESFGYSATCNATNLGKVSALALVGKPLLIEIEPLEEVTESNTEYRSDKEIAEEYKQDIEDIVWELNDIGYYPKAYIVMDYDAHIFLDILNYQDKPVTLGEIKPTLLRVIESIKDEFRVCTIFYKEISFNIKGEPWIYNRNKRENGNIDVLNKNDKTTLAFLTIDFEQVKQPYTPLNNQ